MNIEDKALDVILDYTASSEWEDVCERTWNTDEVQELLIKALEQGQTLPIDSVSVTLPSEDEMYAEMERKFELGKHHDDGMQNDDTQIGWEECYKWIVKRN
jgi:hypothetical protein